MYGIRFLGIAGLALHPDLQVQVGWLLSAADIDAHGGRGSAEFSRYKSQALQFASKEEALAFVLRPSIVAPTRADGEPNRPLTAFNLLIEPL